MTTPEEAVARAREAAAEMRAAGAYAEAEPVRLGPPPPQDAEGRLHQWSFIEPDIAQVYSTRRFGAPMTALKRALLRLLAQYNLQLVANQTRFNAVMVSYVRRLESRVAQLEHELAELERELAELRERDRP
jgi:hypothetical protein